MTIVYFFDDDGKVYLVYGNGTIKIVELKMISMALKMRYSK